jgi:hypothetical protein
MFTDPQVKALPSKLSTNYVRTRQRSCLTLSDIEVCPVAQSMRSG